MDHNGQLPQAHVVADVGSFPLAVVVTGCLETGDGRGQSDAIPVVDAGRRAGWRVMCFILTVGVLLLLVALAQALLASDINKKDIKILDSWAFGSRYPTAGDPSVGLLALSIAALFIFISLLAIGAGGKQRGITVTAAVCAVVSSVVLFMKSFGELAVYIALSINDACMDNIESIFTPRGDCICWAGDIDAGDLRSEISSKGYVEFVNVDIACAAEMSCDRISCDRILFQLDDIRSSYLLMAVCVGVLMITAIVLLVLLQRERDPEAA